MAASSFSGPLQVTGEGVITRPVEVLFVALPAVTAVANTDFTFVLPECRVINITQRTNVLYTGATVELSLGSAVGGAQYAALATIVALSAQRAVVPAAGAGLLLDGFDGGVWHGRIAQTTPTAVGAGVLLIEFVRTGA